MINGLVAESTACMASQRSFSNGNSFLWYQRDGGYQTVTSTNNAF
jgi:hypothetical protein